MNPIKYTKNKSFLKPRLLYLILFHGLLFIEIFILISGQIPVFSPKSAMIGSHPAFSQVQEGMWSTYLGGPSNDEGIAIDVDTAGYIYVVGTASTNFPTTNAYDAIYNGNIDVFVSKFTADGQSLIYSTYLGGSEDDYGLGMAVDAEGYIYITGATTSTNFPTVNAYDATFNGGAGFFNVFVTKLAADGQSLIYSTYLGDYSWAGDIVVDTLGCAYVIGYTNSPNYPTINAFDSTLNGISDAFVTKFTSNGQSLIYSTYLGGSNLDSGNDLAVDAEGCVYITGFTSSIDFPTVNAYDSMFNGEEDVFITKLTSNGQLLNFSTFLGGSGNDRGEGLILDSMGCIFLTGSTYSNDFPTINAYDSSLNGSLDAFVTQFTANGQILNYSTFLGGLGNEYGYDIAIDDLGCIYVAGPTSSSDFPTMNAYDTTFNGNSDVFLTKFAPTGLSISYSTYLGGTAYDDCGDIVIDALDYVYLTGWTSSTDFPTIDAYDTSFNGEGGPTFDVFVTRLDLDIGETENGTIQIDGYPIWGLGFVVSLIILFNIRKNHLE